MQGQNRNQVIMGNTPLLEVRSVPKCALSYDYYKNINKVNAHIPENQIYLKTCSDNYIWESTNNILFLLTPQEIIFITRYYQYPEKKH